LLDSDNEKEDDSDFKLTKNFDQM